MTLEEIMEFLIIVFFSLVLVFLLIIVWSNDILVSLLVGVVFFLVVCYFTFRKRNND